MPRAGTHFVGGVVTAGVVNAVIQWEATLSDPSYRFDWGEVAMCCALGGVVGLLPDLLEPANSPNHRQFFHSLTAAALVAWAISGRHTEGCSPVLRSLLLAAGLGYLSHIALDAQTPKSISVI